MIAKMLSGPQYCCCNKAPIYLGDKGTWFAVCLTCARRFGPHKNATAAKKHWNREMKILWKERDERRKGKS